MSEDKAYKDGHIVWVKLGNNWWPGEVTASQRQPEGLIKHLKRKPYCVVKFFQEDAYEYVKSAKQIFPFQCNKKDEFIKKGIALYNAKNTFMDKFPSDVEVAERLTRKAMESVDTLIINDRPDSIVKAILGQSLTRTSNDYYDIDNATRNTNNTRRSGDSITKILNITPNCTKSSKTSTMVTSTTKSPASIANLSTPSSQISGIANLYRCNLCNFTSLRQNVIIIHHKTHSGGGGGGGGDKAASAPPVSEPKTQTKPISSTLATKLVKSPILPTAVAPSTSKRLSKVSARLTTRGTSSGDPSIELVDATTDADLQKHKSFKADSSASTSASKTTTATTTTQPLPSPAAPTTLSTNIISVHSPSSVEPPQFQTNIARLPKKKELASLAMMMSSKRMLRSSPQIASDISEITLPTVSANEEATTAGGKNENNSAASSSQKEVTIVSATNTTPHAVTTTLTPKRNSEEICRSLLADWNDWIVAKEDDDEEQSNVVSITQSSEKFVPPTNVEINSDIVQTTPEEQDKIVVNAATSISTIPTTSNRIRNIPKKDRRDIVLKEFNNEITLSNSLSSTSTTPPPIVNIDSGSSNSNNSDSVVVLDDVVNSSVAANTAEEPIDVDLTLDENDTVTEIQPKSPPPAPTATTEPTTNNDISSKVKEELVGESIVLASTILSLSCFDFEDEEENDTDVQTSIANLKKKYLSPDKTKDATAECENAEKADASQKATEDTVGVISQKQKEPIDVDLTLDENDTVTEIQPKSPPPAPTATTEPTTNNDISSKVKEELVGESIALAGAETDVATANVMAPTAPLSCFDFEEEEENDTDVLTSIANFKKKYLSPDKTKDAIAECENAEKADASQKTTEGTVGAISQKQNDLNQKDQLLSAEIESILEQTTTTIVDMSAVAGDTYPLTTTSSGSRDDVSVKGLPIKERGKRIFKSRNRSRVDDQPHATVVSTLSLDTPIECSVSNEEILEPTKDNDNEAIVGEELQRDEVELQRENAVEDSRIATKDDSAVSVVETGIEETEQHVVEIATEQPLSVAEVAADNHQETAVELFTLSKHNENKLLKISTNGKLNEVHDTFATLPSKQESVLDLRVSHANSELQKESCASYLNDEDDEIIPAIKHSPVELYRRESQESVSPVAAEEIRSKSTENNVSHNSKKDMSTLQLEASTAEDSVNGLKENSNADAVVVVVNAEQYSVELLNRFTSPTDENSSVGISEAGAEFGSPTSMLDDERLPLLTVNLPMTPTECLTREVRTPQLLPEMQPTIFGNTSEDEEINVSKEAAETVKTLPIVETEIEIDKTADVDKIAKIEIDKTADIKIDKTNTGLDANEIMQDEKSSKSALDDSLDDRSQKSVENNLIGSIVAILHSDEEYDEIESPPHEALSGNELEAEMTKLKKLKTAKANQSVKRKSNRTPTLNREVKTPENKVIRPECGKEKSDDNLTEKRSKARRGSPESKQFQAINAQTEITEATEKRRVTRGSLQQNKSQLPRAEEKVLEAAPESSKDDSSKDASPKTKETLRNLSNRKTPTVEAKPTVSTLVNQLDEKKATIDDIVEVIKSEGKDCVVKQKEKPETNTNVADETLDNPEKSISQPNVELDPLDTTLAAVGVGSNNSEKPTTTRKRRSCMKITPRRRLSQIANSKDGSPTAIKTTDIEKKARTLESPLVVSEHTKVRVTAQSKRTAETATVDDPESAAVAVTENPKAASSSAPTVRTNDQTLQLNESVSVESFEVNTQAKTQASQASDTRNLKSPDGIITELNSSIGVGETVASLSEVTPAEVATLCEVTRTEIAILSEVTPSEVATLSEVTLTEAADTRDTNASTAVPNTSDTTLSTLTTTTSPTPTSSFTAVVSEIRSFRPIRTAVVGGSDNNDANVEPETDSHIADVAENVLVITELDAALNTQSYTPPPVIAVEAAPTPRTPSPAALEKVRINVDVANPLSSQIASILATTSNSSSVSKQVLPPALATNKKRVQNKSGAGSTMKRKKSIEDDIPSFIIERPTTQQQAAESVTAATVTGGGEKEALVAHMQNKCPQVKITRKEKSNAEKKKQQPPPPTPSELTETNSTAAQAATPNEEATMFDISNMPILLSNDEQLLPDNVHIVITPTVAAPTSSVDIAAKTAATRAQFSEKTTILNHQILQAAYATPKQQQQRDRKLSTNTRSKRRSTPPQDMQADDETATHASKMPKLEQQLLQKNSAQQLVAKKQIGIDSRGNKYVIIKTPPADLVVQQLPLVQQHTAVATPVAAAKAQTATFSVGSRSMSSVGDELKTMTSTSTNTSPAVSPTLASPQQMQIATAKPKSPAAAATGGRKHAGNTISLSSNTAAKQQQKFCDDMDAAATTTTTTAAATTTTAASHQNQRKYEQYAGVGVSVAGNGRRFTTDSPLPAKMPKLTMSSTMVAGDNVSLAQSQLLQLQRQQQQRRKSLHQQAAPPPLHPLHNRKPRRQPQQHRSTAVVPATATTAAVDVGTLQQSLQQQQQISGTVAAAFQSQMQTHQAPQQSQASLSSSSQSQAVHSTTISEEQLMQIQSEDIDGTSRILAVTTQPIPGYNETFLLCTLVNNNYKPINNVPLYLDHDLNQLVPVPQEALDGMPNLIVNHPSPEETINQQMQQQPTSAQQLQILALENVEADSSTTQQQQQQAQLICLQPVMEGGESSTAEEMSAALVQQQQQLSSDAEIVTDADAAAAAEMAAAVYMPSIDEGGASEIVAENAVILNFEGQQIILDAATFAHLLADPDANTQLITDDGTEFVLTREVLAALEAQQEAQNAEEQQQQHQQQQLQQQLQLQQQHQQQQHHQHHHIPPTDILAVALAGSDLYGSEVLEIETSQVPGLQLISDVVFQQPPPHLTPPITALTSETNALLNQTPIMSPLEKPSTASAALGKRMAGGGHHHHHLLAGNVGGHTSSSMRPNLDDSLAVIGVTAQSSTVPTSLELPITVTNPAIAPKVTMAPTQPPPLVDIAMQFHQPHQRPVSHPIATAAGETTRGGGIYNDPGS